MKHRKQSLQWLSFMLVLVLALVLAACGGAGDNGAAVEDDAAETTSDAVAEGDLVRLTHWYHQYGEEGTQEAAARYAEECGAEVGADVEMVWVPGEYGDKLNAALLTDEAPDVFETQLNLDLVRSGLVAPLDDIYGDALDDFAPQALAANTIDGTLYGVKMIDDMGLLYYRKSMLEEAGVEPPTTLDELGAAIDALSQDRVKGLFMGNDGGIGVMASNILWSSGNERLDGIEVGFDNERTVEAFEQAQTFVADHGDGILVGAPTDWWDPSAFNDGLVAMQWTGLWAMPGIQAALGDDFGVLPWPALDAEGEPVTFWGGWSQFVNAKGDNVDKAKEYVQCLWINNTEIQQDWALSYGFHVPPRKSAAAEAEPLKTGPAAEAVEILYANGHADPPIWNGAMGTAYGDAVDNILRNGADPAAELQAAAETVRAELERLDLE